MALTLEQLEAQRNYRARKKAGLIAPRANPPGRKPLAAAYRGKFPASWGDLPPTAPREVEAEWVHGNYVLVVVEDTRGGVRYLWDAGTKPPSWGAVRYMMRAGSGQNTWDRDIFSKSVGDGEEEAEKVRGERKAVVEIERVLGLMLEGL